jgi:hypothetical protein
MKSCFNQIVTHIDPLTGVEDKNRLSQAQFALFIAPIRHFSWGKLVYCRRSYMHHIVTFTTIAIISL